MIFLLRTFLFTCLILGFLQIRAVAAQNAEVVPISTSADYAVIMDYETGDILFAKNADVPVPPASMSKLMTAAIVFDMLKTGDLALDDDFHVSEKAWSWKGSKMWVLVDTDIKLENLIRGLIIQSGNDAGIVIAENISGSEEAFADLMNRKAREWGLVNSYFVNATGWPGQGQRMSMGDLAHLARKIIRDYPEYYPIFSESEFTWSNITQQNRNPLLQAFEGADGLKTGHTEEAGFGLVGSAVQNGKRRILVLNGLESEAARIREARRMMTIAFDEFKLAALFSANDQLAEADVFKGREKTVNLVIKEPVRLLIHEDLIEQLMATVRYDGPVAAPVLADQQIGYLQVRAPDRQPLEYPLYAESAVAEVGWLGKIGLAARRLLLKPEDQMPQVERDQQSASAG